MQKLRSEKDDLNEEIKIYFLNSFGDSTRLDYGTGHELCFIFFLLSCNKLNIFKNDQHSCLVLKVFNRLSIINLKYSKFSFLNLANL